MEPAKESTKGDAFFKMTSTRNAAAASPAVGNGSFLEKLREAINSQKGKKIMFLVRFLLSLLSILYLVGIVKLAYYSVFYDLQIPEASQTAFCWRMSFICFCYTALLLYTRGQFITKLCIMLSMPFHLFIFLANYEYLVLIIPMGIMIVLTYFFSGVKEGPKTLFGAVFVMIYIIGTFLFLAAGSLLTTTSIDDVVDKGTSPLGGYRYEIVQVTDKADGSTYVAIEPNDYDIRHNECMLYAKGYRKKIYIKRPMCKFVANWGVEKREDITAQLLRINKETTFTLNAEQMKLIGLDKGYTKDYEVGDLSRKQRRNLDICLEKDLIGEQTAESQGLTLKKSTDVITLTFEQLRDLGLTIAYEARLADLTDADLAALGVPEENDVLAINGKIVFRQYVAILERTYDPSSRDIDSFLDS